MILKKKIFTERENFYFDEERKSLRKNFLSQKFLIEQKKSSKKKIFNLEKKFFDEPEIFHFEQKEIFDFLIEKNF